MIKQGKNFRNQMINVVSSDHCQANSDKTLYKLKVLKTPPIGGNKHRRRTRRKSKPRRRSVTKTRRKRTRRKTHKK